jgi:hypothetical protein
MPGLQQHYCLDLVDRTLRSLFPPERCAKGTIRARINERDPGTFECDVQAPVEYVAEIVAALDQKLKGLEYRIVVRCS